MNRRDFTVLVADLCDIYVKKIKDLEKEVAVWKGNAAFWQARLVDEKAQQAKAKEAFKEAFEEPWFSLD